MGGEDLSKRLIDSKLTVLRDQLTAMADDVESLFADLVVTIMEGDWALADEISIENFKAHDLWLKLDRGCVDLLATGELSPAEVRFVCSALKIGMDLKMTAEESLAIFYQSRALRASSSDVPLSIEPMSRMVELTQELLNQTIESLVDQSPCLAEQAVLAHRQLRSLNKHTTESLVEELAVPPGTHAHWDCAAGLMLIGSSLKRVGDYVFDASKHIAQLYGRHEGKPEQGQDR